MVEGGVERGQQGKDLGIRMRRAFKMFLTHAGIPDGRISVALCGSRGQTYQEFCRAVRQVDSARFPLLLVDSETAVPQGISPWTFLERSDDWQKPAEAGEDHAHLMVECMENWFLADRQAVADYYGNGFQTSALPATQPVESARKEDVLDGLARASRNTRKGSYSKGQHAFAILERVDPRKVAQSVRWACRLLVILEKRLNLPRQSWRCELPVV